MVPIGKVVAAEQKNFDLCVAAKNKGALIPKTTIRGSQFQQPLLEFNGACPGCGEPAIMKLLTQLYGDHLLIACATGCSLVWGATYPFNPWCTNELGQGPAWANSLFEDNAEFGFGMYHAILARRNITKKVVQTVVDAGKVTGQVKDLLSKLLQVWDDETQSVAISNKLQPLLKELPDADVDVKRLKSQADVLGKKAVWIMGGDGWAYDIGYGGLDHVIASGEDVKVIVLDTEVYSNTGGQCSKATQRGAVANFSAAGYTKQKKDLGAIAITYGNIYVASTCLLADPQQALKALLEAQAYKGPALIINYTPCINQGIKKGLGSTPAHCKELVQTGYIILYRFDPRRAAEGKPPLQLDCKQPKYDLAPLTKGENRFSALVDLYPKEAQVKHPALLEDLKRRYNYYAKMAQQKP
jgi:pyruvate-ferredoxin/flavodoxin oxidoreductase